MDPLLKNRCAAESFTSSMVTRQNDRIIMPLFPSLAEVGETEKKKVLMQLDQPRPPLWLQWQMISY